MVLQTIPYALDLLVCDERVANFGWDGLVTSGRIS